MNKACPFLYESKNIRGTVGHGKSTLVEVPHVLADNSATIQPSNGIMRTPIYQEATTPTLEIGKIEFTDEIKRLGSTAILPVIKGTADSLDQMMVVALMNPSSPVSRRF